MKLNDMQYSELVEHLAEELVDGAMEKQADSFRDVVEGNRDFSDPKKSETKFWGDRVGTPMIATIPVNAAGESINKLTKGSVAPAVRAASLGAVIGINAKRGSNLAAKNNQDFTAGDTVLSTFVPFISPDSIVKKKVREHRGVSKAAEALIEAVIVKQAALSEADEALMVCEASEMALNYLGYTKE